jgi:hypothetical protein
MTNKEKVKIEFPFTSSLERWIGRKLNDDEADKLARAIWDINEGFSFHGLISFLDLLENVLFTQVGKDDVTDLEFLTFILKSYLDRFDGVLKDLKNKHLEDKLNEVKNDK